MLGLLPLPVRRHGVRPATLPAEPAIFDFTGGAMPEGATLFRPTGALGAGQVLYPADAPRLFTDLGLLMEPAATNLLPDSVDLQAAGWFGLNALCTGGQAGAPDGSSTGFRIDVSGGGGARYLHPLLASGDPLTLSAWLWSPEGDPGRLVITVNGSFVAHGPTVLDATPRRLSLSHTPPAGASLEVGFIAGGVGDLSVRVWRPQLETGDRASSAIATLGGPAIRAADSLQLDVAPRAHLVAVRRSDGVTTVEDIAAEPLGQDGGIAIDPDPDYPYLVSVAATPLG